jgi:glycine/D-amino acid oxidase-like deaminating enzyme
VGGVQACAHAEEIFGPDHGLRQTGYGVGVSQENSDNMRQSLTAQRAVGVQTQEIDKSEVAKLWPAANLEPFGTFAWEARGGYGDAYQTAQAFMVEARATGVRLRQNSPVVRLLIDGDRVSGVELAEGTKILADTVVVATGAWTRPFLAPYRIDIPLTVHREQIVIVSPGIDLGSVPVFSDLVSLQYIRPEVGGEVLFGNSDLTKLDIADPDHYLNRADEAFLDLTVQKISTRFPGLDNASISSSYAGCYDVTPDWNPVISRCDVAGLVIAAGFSGHGFKIAPAVGRLIADLIIEGRSNDPRIPEKDFRLTRFSEGDPLTTRFPYLGAGEMR